MNSALSSKQNSTAHLVFAATLLFLSFLAALRVAHAQVPAANGLSLTLSNEHPEPGQTLTISAEDYATDLNKAKMTWIADGKTIQSGTGIVRVTVTAPAFGKSLRVSVSAATKDVGFLQASATIVPNSVDMIIENDGYVPPFFKGKGVSAFQNNVKVIAMPHFPDGRGGEVDPGTLIYKWSKNNSVIQDQSGYGKQSVIIAGDIIPREAAISVEVSSPTSADTSANLVTVTPESPTIGFYVDDPLYGVIYDRAVDGTANLGKKGELSVRAVPYGFNGYSPTSSKLSFNWSLNGYDDATLDAHSSITLRAPADSNGLANISLAISNPAKILQGATGDFAAQFIKTDAAASAYSSTSAARTPIQF